jgi:IS5 family transposase
MQVGGSVVENWWVEVDDMQRTPQPPTTSLLDDYYFRRLVPTDDPLLKIDACTDWSFVYEEVLGLYHAELGRPALDPVVMLKLCFLQSYCNLADREVMRRAQTDLLFRVFLGLDVEEPLPHHSSLSVFRARLGDEVFKRIFNRLVGQAVAEGLVSNELALVDSYGIEADVRVPRFRKLLSRVITQALGVLEEGGEEVAAVRQEAAELHEDTSWRLSKELAQRSEEQWVALAGLVHERLERLSDGSARREEVLELLAAALDRKERKRSGGYLVSDIDPDARWKRKKHGRRAFVGYVENIVVDADSELITDVTVAPANLDDSEAFSDLVQGHEANVGAMPQGVVADSGYHSGENRNLLKDKSEDHIAVPTPKGHKQGKFAACDFHLEYDEQGRPVRAQCPHGQWAEQPKWKHQTHSWVFYFGQGQCAGCPLRERCSRQSRGRSLSVSLHHQTHEEARARQATAEGQQRQIERLDIERTFALQQRRHGLKRTRYRGLRRVAVQVYMTCLAVNLARRCVLLEEPELVKRKQEKRHLRREG